jgi:hypothetical protein
VCCCFSSLSSILVWIWDSILRFWFWSRRICSAYWDFWSETEFSVLAPSGKNLRSVLFLRSRYECSPMLPPFGPVTSRFQVAAIISSVSSSPGFLSWPGRRSSSSRSALASSAPDSSASVPSAGLLFLARCFQYCTGRISLVSGSCVEPTPRLSSIRFILGAGPFDFCYRGLGLPPSGTGHRFPPA